MRDILSTLSRPETEIQQGDERSLCFTRRATSIRAHKSHQTTLQEADYDIDIDTIVRGPFLNAKEDLSDLPIQESKRDGFLFDHKDLRWSSRRGRWTVLHPSSSC
ncbi:hypothetical protein FRC03_000752 [Tulasnella sp. 419]|nr:hypothetical protein FRC03_000752 [Tulasnella sp. 419]